MDTGDHCEQPTAYYGSTTAFSMVLIMEFSTSQDGYHPGTLELIREASCSWSAFTNNELSTFEPVSHLQGYGTVRH